VALPIGDNQLVHAGDLIGQIDDADYRARRDQAVAGLQAAQAQLAAINAQRAELQAEIGQSRSAAAASQAAIVRTSPELARQLRLVRTEAGERRALDQAEADQQRMVAAVAVAQAQVQARELQVGILEAQARAAAAGVAARRADLALAELDLGWTRVVSPIDGTLGPRLVRVGDLVAPGTPLVRVTPLDRVWVDANYIERQTPFIRIGQRAVVRVDSFPDATLDARVAGLSPVTGGGLSAVPPDNTTGNFTKVPARVPVRIAIDWGNSRLRGMLRPGMSAEVTVLTDRDN
jgi:membrane fusion protein (multidrug efflux system)